MNTNDIYAILLLGGFVLISQGLREYFKNRKRSSGGFRRFSAKPVSLVRQYPKKKVNWDDGLIQRTSDGTKVRSKSEVIVYDILVSQGLSVKYEKKLFGRDASFKNYRYPDFTIDHQERVWYWEHLGMLDNATYQHKWMMKTQWYKDNGYWSQVITSQDQPGGVLYADDIRKIIHDRIFGLAS